LRFQPFQFFFMESLGLIGSQTTSLAIGASVLDDVVVVESAGNMSCVVWRNVWPLGCWCDGISLMTSNHSDISNDDLSLLPKLFPRFAVGVCCCLGLFFPTSRTPFGGIRDWDDPRRLFPCFPVLDGTRWCSTRDCLPPQRPFQTFPRKTTTKKVKQREPRDDLAQCSFVFFDLLVCHVH
jgi:hypothetical protein